MAGYRHPAGRGIAPAIAPAPTQAFRWAGIHLLTAARRHGEYDPDSIDRIAEQERRRLVDEGVLDAEPVRIYKLRCQACLVLIGPGYAYDEVWYDGNTNRWVCRSCALWPSVDRSRVQMLASREEIADLSIGELGRVMQQRTRRIRKGSTS